MHQLCARCVLVFTLLHCGSVLNAFVVVGITARCIETSIVLALFAVLLHGGFRVTQSIWSGISPLSAASTSAVSLFAHNIPGLLMFMCMFFPQPQECLPSATATKTIIMFIF